VVVDPSNDNTLYLATDIAGVWKSTDAARHWSPANNGIRNPMTTSSTYYGLRPLGIDPTNPQRLLYGTTDDDLRAGPPYSWGGLYSTSDGAATWQHVDLPGCPGPDVRYILFQGGTAYVSTVCGIFVGTGDLTSSSSWSVIDFPTADPGWPITISGDALFTCGGTEAYRRRAGAWSAPITLDGTCRDITVSPDAPASRAYVVVWVAYPQSDPLWPGFWEVESVDFAANTHSQLGDNPNTPADPTTPGRDVETCCGQPSVWTVRRPNGTGTGPGNSFDVFVANMLNFYQYDPSTSTWKVISGPHVDTFSLAFPSLYDPDRGNCTAYMTDDGGVHKSLSSGTGCTLWDDGRQWVNAMSGLHTMFGYTMAVVPQPAAGGRPRPAIYLPTGDNAAWGTLDGGATWQDMGCCGDNGKALVDLALPHQMLTMRNGMRVIYRSSTDTPPVASDRGVNLAGSYTFNGKSLHEGTAPPSSATFAQVMTLPGEAREEQGDYLQAAGNPASATATDEIIRTITGTKEGWRSISAYFTGLGIGSIQPSGGHTDTTVYVMTMVGTGGGIFRGQVSGDAASGTIPEASWQQLPFPDPASPEPAEVLFADPYRANVLYAMSASAVFSSQDAGQRWTEETDLMRILTRNHEFRAICNHAEAFRQTNYSCTLNSVFFDRNDPSIRAVASVTGALAFSRDGGGHWISLNEVIDPNTRPSTVAYDSTINPETGTPSLYYNALNRSMTRIDAPFPTLESATYELRRLGPGHVVSAVNATTGTTTVLTREADGVYRGYDDVFDSAVSGTLSYHLVIDGDPTAEFTHTLTDTERTAGVVVLDPCTDPDGDGFGPPGLPASICPVDNCPLVYNPRQRDRDADGFGDRCDNCPRHANPGQEDADSDGQGDVCDGCTDTDDDGSGDPGFPANRCSLDNCPFTPNPDQADQDDDTVGDLCDNCFSKPNLDQSDSNGNGLGDACDPEGPCPRECRTGAIPCPPGCPSPGGGRGTARDCRVSIGSGPTDLPLLRLECLASDFKWDLRLGFCPKELQAVDLCCSGGDCLGPTLRLSLTDGRDAWIQAPDAFGLTEADGLGFSAAFVPDRNGDGRPDLAVGAPWADPQGREDAGSVVILSGQDGRPLSRVDGGIAGGLFGFAVADHPAGLLVGAPFSSSFEPFPVEDASTQTRTAQGLTGAAPGTGSVHLVSVAGKVVGEIDGSVAGSRFGAAVQAVPDVDGDGAQEILIGAPGAGSRGEEPGSVFLYSLNGKREGEYRGQTAGEGFGQAVSVSSLDTERLVIAIGAPFVGQGRGRVDILSTKGELVSRLEGRSAGDQFGSSLSGGLDASGDGRPDLLVGAPLADAEAGVDSGAAYLYSIDGALLASYGGREAGDHRGRPVLLTDDMNDDGVAEVLLGAPLSESGGSFLLLPSAVDSDEDGFADALDNCPDAPNPDQGDSDGDGIGDACDACSGAAGVVRECLDSRFDRRTGLSEWVVKLGGGARHVHGDGRCGERGHYRLPLEGSLTFKTPATARAQDYELHLLTQARYPSVLDLSIGGKTFRVPLERDHCERGWAWTRPIPVTLRTGSARVTVRVERGGPVRIEAAKLVPACGSR
jgi:hypothetical protein